MLTLTGFNFDSLLSRASGVTVVLFGQIQDEATRQWQTLLPELTLGMVDRLAFVDMGTCPELVGRYAVDSLPALLVFRNGQYLGEVAMHAERDALRLALYSVIIG